MQEHGQTASALDLLSLYVQLLVQSQAPVTTAHAVPFVGVWDTMPLMPVATDGKLAGERKQRDEVMRAFLKWSGGDAVLHHLYGERLLLEGDADRAVSQLLLGTLESLQLLASLPAKHSLHHFVSLLANRLDLKDARLMLELTTKNLPSIGEYQVNATTAVKVCDDQLVTFCQMLLLSLEYHRAGTFSRLRTTMPDIQVDDADWQVLGAHFFN